MTAYSLIAQTVKGPVTIQTGTEDEIRAEYRRRMRLLAAGDQADEVRDFAIGVPAIRERRAEEADVAMALMAQFDGTHARKKGR